MTHLGPLAQYGLRRFGDLLIPGDGELPSFSQSGCTVHLASEVAEMHPADCSDLRIAAGLLALMTEVGRMCLLALLERGDSLPEFLGQPCRTALFNFRALLFSLYYAHPPVLAAMGYEVAVYVGDLRNPENAAMFVGQAGEELL